MEARKEMESEAANVIGKIDPYREIEILPPGMVNGNTLRRTRGERSDEDCIDEICELVARDLTLKMALTWVGVPELGWYIWNCNDVHGIKAKYAVAQQCNLDNMADATIDAFEELKAKFEAAQEAHIQEIVEWEKWSPPADNPDMRRPPPPVYKGPTEMNLKIAEARDSRRASGCWRIAALPAKSVAVHHSRRQYFDLAVRVDLGHHVACAILYLAASPRAARRP